MVPGGAQERRSDAEADPTSASLLAQLRRGALEYCVLAMLSDEPRYGFDIVRSLAEQPGMTTGEGTIYPLLTRLRNEGKVDATWQPSETGPPRRYYTVTPAGRSALDHFVVAWTTFRSTVDTILSRRSPS